MKERELEGEVADSLKKESLPGPSLDLPPDRA
jgi:hypothetical protein